MNRLKQSESIFISFIVLLMLSIVVIGRINARRTSAILATHPFSSHRKCEIEIEGEVAKPGVYHAYPGTPLKNIIKKSMPTPYADLKRISIDQRIESSLKVKIDRLKEITIFVEGKPYIVPAGTKICHLKKYIEIANHKISKSHRYLKDGEIISFIE